MFLAVQVRFKELNAILHGIESAGSEEVSSGERRNGQIGGKDMKLHIGIVGALWLTATALWAADEKPAAPKVDPRAAALLQEAGKTRYVWSPEMNVVSGKFTWEKDGQNGAGTFRSVLHQRGGLTISAEGNAEVPAEVKDHIGSMIMHRVGPAPGAPERLQPASVILVEDEERGPLILTLGDAMNSSQRVKDGKLVQVNRLMGGKRFTINVTQFEKSPDGERVYPSAFTVTWWDAASGNKLEKQKYTTQGFQLVDGQMFPKAETVVSEKGDKTTNLLIRYSDIKFETLPPKAAGN
jgi:hypothetical protein